MLEIIDYVQRGGFTEVIISTPGPIGLCALLAAKILGLKTSAIYHTDFPQYVRILTDDSWLETLTWNYMQWFYEQMDIVYVNSGDYRLALEARGIKGTGSIFCRADWTPNCSRRRAATKTSGSGADGRTARSACSMPVVFPRKRNSISSPPWYGNSGRQDSPCAVWWWDTGRIPRNSKILSRRDFHRLSRG